MANLDEVTVDVKVKLSIDQKTAETCLKIVEEYINENRLQVVTVPYLFGKVELRYEPA